ncbi:MAG: DNA repair and recombination protein RadA, partial [Nanoarchaeota archaeon]|nr:DNA repair and recombination protein RadA [Nanoarchaeota archaeon]MBU1269944.1 DNA repair and recombination protein RadA [Nanoarchaeota archaeon]MBU1604185.1 DNA repair and recombination protein RadA [Nanoarchaeota archaeon]MBU2443086.1 DNA repair and recombination protein RadA [Nanoarchaeota archaeon]
MKEEKIKEEKTQEVQITKKEPKQTQKKEKIIEDLPGVGAATAEKLRAVGYDNFLKIAVSSPGELIEIAGVGEPVARKMIQAARDSLEMGFQTGADLLKKRETLIRITTGSKNFDDIMGGGFETCAITECFGAYGSSKTQIAHQLAVNCQAKDPDAVAVYIDTENTFRPERIKQMAEGQKLNPEKILKNVKVARAFNSDHQMLLAEKVESLIKQGMKVQVLIVDSLTAHFRAEFIGRGTLAERQQKLNKHMHTLAKLADMYNLCVYVTNQVMSKPDQFFGDPTEAIGGHVVAHNSTFRIYLRRGKKGTRVAKLVDAPNLPDAEAIFNINDSGLSDL